MIAEQLRRAMNAYRRQWLGLYPAGRVRPRMARYVRDATELASNPYVDDFDMAQLYNQAYWGIGHRRRRGSLRRPRPGRHHHRRRGRRFRGPRYWRPLYTPSFVDTRVMVMRNLARKIRFLWRQLPNKRKWARSVGPEMRTPSTFFARYPMP